MQKPRLNALELHGYKTFAGRVLFEFPGNVTAIVGPNGSGKSNIADALRWVLGEQSYTLLRGKKTEDMIFLGSDQRPRAGMASATINFDNGSGWLPIDYSEVAVSRRAYRDGSNEYFLNKQRVRLKDISELLAQSGLAERTYTIIGQGLVDAALSLRPEERRRFFEEAAGIGLFRSRREDALNRLENTRRNLERVGDILSELEPRMKSLERQAKRIEEFDRVKDDLHVLLKDWYGFHWQNTQKELIRNREILKNQEARVNTARDQRTAIEKQVDESRLRLQEVRAKLNQWHGESSQLHNRRELLSKEIAVLEERLRSSRSLLQTFESQLIREKEQNQNLTIKLDGILSDQKLAKQEYSESLQQLDQAKSRFNQREVERAEVDKRMHEERRKLVEIETRMVRSKAHQSELQNRLVNLKNSQTTLTEGIKKSGNELTDSKDRVEETIILKQAADGKVQNTVEKLERLARSITSTEEEVRNKTSDISRLSAEIAKVSAQIEVLTQAQNALSGMSEGAKSLLVAARSGKVSRKLDPLNMILEVPADLEIAVSSALGDLLDGVVFSPDEDPELVLNWLENDDSGKAVLLPAQQGRVSEKMKMMKAANVIGVAADLVKCRSEYSSLITLLLGNVLVVEDRTTARMMVKEIPNWGKIVTRKGEVFSGNGVIIAGKEKRSGLISRQRQKQDFEVSLSKLKKELIHQEGSLDAAQKELDDLIEERHSLNSLLKEQQKEQAETQKATDQATRALEQFTQRLEWQNSQVNILIGQINGTEAELTTLQQELENGNKQVQEITERMQADGNSLGGLPIDELQAEVVHWNTTVALNERAVRDHERRIAEFEQTIIQSKHTLSTTEKKLEELQNQILEAEKDGEAKRVQETEINRESGLIQQEIDPAETELSSIENQYAVLQQGYSQAQQVETNADRVYSQAHLDMTRSREALESLRRKIEEDFGLVALEYSEDVSGPTPLPLEGVNKLVTLTEIPKELEESINRQRALLRRMGAINPEAKAEFLEVKERFEFMTSQVNDLLKADTDLRQVIAELDEIMQKQFQDDLYSGRC